jgi:hypothetical protein
MVAGFLGWFVLRYLLTSFYTVDQNERAVKNHLWTGRTRGQHDHRRRAGE